MSSARAGAAGARRQQRQQEEDESARAIPALLLWGGTGGWQAARASRRCGARARARAGRNAIGGGSAPSARPRIASITRAARRPRRRHGRNRRPARARRPRDAIAAAEDQLAAKRWRRLEDPAAPARRRAPAPATRRAAAVMPCRSNDAEIFEQDQADRRARRGWRAAASRAPPPSGAASATRSPVEHARSRSGPWRSRPRGASGRSASSASSGPRRGRIIAGKRLRRRRAIAGAAGSFGVSVARARTRADQVATRVRLELSSDTRTWCQSRLSSPGLEPSRSRSARAAAACSKRISKVGMRGPPRYRRKSRSQRVDDRRMPLRPPLGRAAPGDQGDIAVELARSARPKSVR